MDGLPALHRAVSPEADELEVGSRHRFVRRRLGDFVGQSELKEKLAIVLEAARRREQPVDHMLFAGPPGLGKTTLAGIVAAEMGTGFRITSGPALTRGGDLAAILTGLQHGDVLFIDEIHRLNRAVEEILYPAMEDFEIDIIIGKGPSARSVRLPLPSFTLVGATTRSGLVTGPLRDRFGFVTHLEHYRSRSSARSSREPASCSAWSAPRTVRERSPDARAGRLDSRSDSCAASATSSRCAAPGRSPLETAREGCTLFGVDDLGLDRLDRAILDTLCRRFAGRPVGLDDARGERQRGSRDHRGRLRAVSHASRPACNGRRGEESRPRPPTPTSAWTARRFAPLPNDRTWCSRGRALPDDRSSRSAAGTSARPPPTTVLNAIRPTDR
jgi:Holliday junction DNA helicase RuvB